MTERDKGPRIRKVPAGDNRQRLVCPDCEYVAYENPKVVVGVVATWEDKLLMCKRAIEPRLGYWTLPAGFMEMDESPQEGAAREAWEEAYAKLEIIDLLAVYSLSHISQLQLFYRARLLSPDVAPQEDSPGMEAAFTRFREVRSSRRLGSGHTALAALDLMGPMQALFHAQAPDRELKKAAFPFLSPAGRWHAARRPRPRAAPGGA